MSNQSNLTATDSTEFIREVLLKELDYRREKQWRLFSWTSTILTAIIGGCVALKTEALQPNEVRLAWPLQYKIALSLSVIALAWYACSWIEHNWARQKVVVNEINACCRDNLSNNEGGNLKALNTEDKFLTYNMALILLAASAGVAIWM